MAAKNEIVVVDGDDWIGLYINGELDVEGHGHSRHADILAWGAQYAPATVRLIFVDSAWMESQGRLPQKLSDVQVSSEEQPRAELAAQ